MAETMLECAQVIAGETSDEASVSECIRFLNNASEDDLENNENEAESILKLAMEGVSQVASTGGKQSILSLLTFLHKANANDKWLVAGCTQVLPFLYPFALQVLSRLGTLGQLLKENGSPKTTLTIAVSSSLTSNERAEIGAELLELCVDYCDVASKDAEAHVSVLAELSVKVLFYKPAQQSDNEGACAIDYLKRAASFALSNAVESFPGTIPTMHTAIQPKRKEFVQCMLRSPEASIQRSIIRFISVLYNCKKDDKFCFADIRAVVAVFLRKNSRKSKQSDAVLGLFQKIDIADDDSFSRVEEFRALASSYLGIRPCLVTGQVDVCLIDSKHVSERKFSAASVDWDQNSFSVQHDSLKRLRIPWSGLKSVQWSAAGGTVSILAEYNFLREIRVTFGSNWEQKQSDANRVYEILRQYKAPCTEVALERDVMKLSARKASLSQIRSTDTVSRPTQKAVMDSPVDGTIFGGLLSADGFLSSAIEDIDVDTDAGETDDSEESPVPKTRPKTSAMKHRKSTGHQKSAVHGKKNGQLLKNKGILDGGDDEEAKSRGRKLSWKDCPHGSMVKNSYDGSDDDFEEEEKEEESEGDDGDIEMDDGSIVESGKSESSGSLSDSYVDDEIDERSDDGEREEEDDEEATVGSMSEGSADSFVSMDDDGTEFRGKLLKIVEQRLKMRKQENKRIIEEARKKLARIDAEKAKEDAANCADFARFIRQEALKKKKNVAEWARKGKRAIANRGRASEGVNLSVLEKEGAKLRKAVGKQLRECKVKLGTTHEMLGKTLGSMYESIVKRHKSANKSDTLFRGISQLLTSKDL